MINHLSMGHLFVKNRSVWRVPKIDTPKSSILGKCHCQYVLIQKPTLQGTPIFKNPGANSWQIFCAQEKDSVPVSSKGSWQTTYKARPLALWAWHKVNSVNWSPNSLNSRNCNNWSWPKCSANPEINHSFKADHAGVEHVGNPGVSHPTGLPTRLWYSSAMALRGA